MRQYEHRTRGDVITVPKELEKRYDEDPAWKRYTSPAKKTAAPKKTAAKKTTASNPSSTTK